MYGAQPNVPTRLVNPLYVAFVGMPSSMRVQNMRCLYSANICITAIECNPRIFGGALFDELLRNGTAKLPLLRLLRRR